MFFNTQIQYNAKIHFSYVLQIQAFRLGTRSKI